MDDFCDYEEYFNDPSSLVSVMPHDDYDEYQRIQEELYEKAFEAEFSRVASFHNNSSSHTYSNVKDCNNVKKSPVHGCSEAVLEKKRKRSSKNDKASLLTKKPKTNKNDDGDELNAVNKEKSVVKSNKVKRSLKSRSLNEMVEDAGLTMTDLKAFIGNEKFDYDHDSASEISSNYIVISETSEHESNDASDDDSDWENIDLNIVNRSLSRDDVTLTRILDSLPDDSSWNISTSDIIGQSRSSIPRFHNLMKKVRCSNCTERGHYASLCPQPKKVIKCILCGEMGHVYRSCPDQLCFKCDLPGHSARDCDMRVASYHDKCKRCFLRGHFEEKCPDTWRQYHLTISEGKIFRERDIKNEEVTPREKIRSCYNCGESGHLGHTCQESRMDKFQTVCTPYIFKYDKESRKSEKVDAKRKANIDNDKGCNSLNYPKDANDIHYKKHKFNREEKRGCFKLSFLNDSEKHSSPKDADDLQYKNHKFNREEKRRGFKFSFLKGDDSEKHSNNTSQGNSKSRKSDKESFDISNNSGASINLGDGDSGMHHPGRSKSQGHTSANVVPLMDLDITVCSSTPINIFTKKRAEKFIESDSFPRDISLNFANRRNVSSLFSPIVSSKSKTIVDESPERTVNSYMGEVELQNSYYGAKEMKKARKKQAKKEKKQLLRQQRLEERVNDAKHKKPWWSVPKSQQSEQLRESNFLHENQFAPRRTHKGKNVGKKFDSNYGGQTLPGKRKKPTAMSSIEEHGNNITDRGFRLGAFQ